MLYQLSYSRVTWRGLDLNQRRLSPADLQSAPFGRSGTPPDLLDFDFSCNTNC